MLHFGGHCHVIGMLGLSRLVQIIGRESPGMVEVSYDNSDGYIAIKHFCCKGKSAVLLASLTVSSGHHCTDNCL